MFENVAAEDLLGRVRVHEFDHRDDPMGAEHIDAIRAMDRVIRAAQALQADHIARLDRLRASEMTLGRGDSSLSVIGELGMARGISPSAAGTQYGSAVGLATMPRLGAALSTGTISEFAARLVVRESTGLNREQVRVLDEALRGRLDGLTARKAGELARAERSASMPLQPEHVQRRIEQIDSSPDSPKPMATPALVGRSPRPSLINTDRPDVSPTRIHEQI